MEGNENLRFKERSLDELLEHLTSDMPPENQLNNVHFAGDSPYHVHMGRGEYCSENLEPSALHRNVNNVYFQDNYHQHGRGSLPFIFNTREDVMPAMVDVGGGNFVVYGTSNAQRSPNVPNIHFVKNTNGNLTGFNNYGVEYSSGSDYNLFSNNSAIPSQASTIPQFCQPTGNTPKAQLIENLVGNWTSDQSGTYSPFGSCLGGVGAPSSQDSIGRGSRSRTRMVAEVRPMRPSYSDVLAKSINNAAPGSMQQPSAKPAGKKEGQEVKAKPVEVKPIKPAKGTAGRTLSGSGNGLNRQHSAALDDQTFFGLRGPGRKKAECDPPEGLSKKWLSLDDLQDARPTEYISLNKKSSPKPISKKQKPTEAGSGGPGKAPAGNAKPQVVKKEQKSKEKGEKEKEKETKLEGGKVKNGEDKKGPQSKGEPHSKQARRNSRSFQSEKHGGRSGGSGRSKRRDQEPCLPAILRHRLDQYVGLLLLPLRWLMTLVLDVAGLSMHLMIDMFTIVWTSTVLNSSELYGKLGQAIRNIELLQRIANSRFWPFKRKEERQPADSDDESDSGGAKAKSRIPRGLKHNIQLPATGDEAMRRLLACKGKDPYSILGVTQNCTDDDIKKYYKRQAFLVHPDKNNQPGAEEAFKILVHAFDIIGEPEHRKSYDRRVEKTQQVEQAWSELSDLLSKLHKKMEHVANTIRCTNCGQRHKRGPTDRPVYAARLCRQCKIHHSAREGDIWAESSMMGMVWRYYACMDGAVYDVTEWAGCQGGNLRNLQPNTHHVQYRIVVDRQQGKGGQQRTQQPSEPDLEDFLSNLYTKSDSGTPPGDGDTASSAGRKRKSKRKK